MQWKRLMWVCAWLVAGACGDDAKDGSTDTPADSGDGDDDATGGTGENPASGACSKRHCDAPDLYTCFEWGVDDAEHRQLCGQLGGEVGEGACPAADKVAGCKSSSPFSNKGCVINWGYAPALAEDDVREDCDERKGKLVR